MATIKDTAENIFQRAKLLYLDQAQKISKNDVKLKKLMDSASVKLQKFSKNPQVVEMIGHVDVLFRMIRAHVNGSYKGFSTKSLGMIALGLVYFVTPIDLIPDFIPVIGYVDDLTVLLAVIKTLQSDIQKFVLWEQSYK
ncbi:YkvA family protein [Litoribacter populi]|uniref:YkvA family protein n=1 Tax=Litoribacter populi TaxID=2598460 RepID=UPI00117CC588|nr:YkvA family protein [Litoribacter populi]